MTVDEIKVEGARLGACAVAVLEIGNQQLPFFFHQNVAQAREFCAFMGSGKCMALGKGK